MKRLSIIFLLVFISFAFTGCKKNKLEGSFDKVDFHISGIYIEMDKDSTYRVDRLNPAIYYEHKTKQLSASRGGYNLEYSNIINNTTEEDGVIKIKIFVKILFPFKTPDRLNIYVVKENGTGSHYVDQSMTDVWTMNNTKDYRIAYKYTYGNQKYQFQFEIKYSRSEA